MAQIIEIKHPSKFKLVWWKIVPYTFILLPLALYLIFYLIPSFQSFYYSFFEWNGYSKDMTFIGLENYREILFEDRLFSRAITNNFLWTLGSLILPLSIGLLLAVVFNAKGMQGRNFFRTAIFMPYVLSVIVVSLLWQEIYNPQNGILNSIIELITGEEIHFAYLGHPSTALVSVLIAATWGAVGFYMVIFDAGLQTIPNELYEVAEIEGANFIQSFFYVTLPMMKEVITVMITTTIIGSFKVFDIIYTMTHGGPLHATEVTATRMISEAFSYSRFGYAAAYSCLIFLIIAALSFFYLRLNRRRIGD